MIVSPEIRVLPCFKVAVTVADCPKVNVVGLNVTVIDVLIPPLASGAMNTALNTTMINATLRSAALALDI